MAIAIKTNGTTSTSLIHATDFNQYSDILTGVMTDTPLTFRYNPGADTTNPVLALFTDGHAPLLQALNSSNAVVVQVDKNGKTTLDAGTISTDGSGNIQFKGKLGVGAAGNVLDGSGFDTYLFCRGGSNVIHFQNSAARELGSFSNTGLSILPGNATTPSVITVGVALGIKNNAGTKLAEVKSDGKFVIAGSTYYTTQSTISTAASASFDGFDVAEVTQFDRKYDSGTVVCPGGDDLYTLCTHDNCPAASVISNLPGMCMGEPDESKFIFPLALTGRVKVRTAIDMTFKTPVTSDGRGGVRPVRKGELSYIIGFTLNSTKQGMVGIQLRAMSVSL